MNPSKAVSLWLGRDSRQQQSRAPGWMCLFGADVCPSCPSHFHLLEAGACSGCVLAHVTACIAAAGSGGELRGRRRALGIHTGHNPLRSPEQRGTARPRSCPALGGGRSWRRRGAAGQPDVSAVLTMAGGTKAARTCSCLPSPRA